jgi:pyruvate/2-oxoglutarate dehydrogenase complex dihydrolipoamide dehydrogenase (E3) component
MSATRPAARAYDAIVIGSGQGGNPLALDLARSGLRTAMVERKHVGGTCVNVGCTPTKTMVASARIAALARRAAEYGVETGPVRVDLAAVRKRKQAIVDEFRAGSQGELEETANLDPRGRRRSR